MSTIIVPMDEKATSARSRFDSVAQGSRLYQRQPSGVYRQNVTEGNSAAAKMFPDKRRDSFIYAHQKRFRTADNSYVASPYGSRWKGASSSTIASDKPCSTGYFGAVMSPGSSAWYTDKNMNQTIKPSASVSELMSDSSFIHAIGRFFTGNVVDVRTNKNEIIRGVFGGLSEKTFSIDKPVRMDSQSLKFISKCQSPLVIHVAEVIEIIVAEVEKDEVVLSSISNCDESNVSTNLRTDSEIAYESRARPNGTHGDQADDGIHLTPFYDEGAEPKNLEGLELNGEDGWTPKQMFSTNEALGVNSTYDPTLAEYTTELVKEDTVEYRQREARASALAAEIEGNADSKAMADRENDDGIDEDDDEEMRFSAVQRQSHAPPNRPGGRIPHNERGGQHLGPRAGQQASQPLRSMGRGRSSHSYRTGPGAGNVGPGSNPGSQPARTADLLEFSKRFHLTKGPQASAVGGQAPPSGSGHLMTSQANPGRKELNTAKNAPRNKRSYAQQPQPAPSGGPRTPKTDEALPPGAAFDAEPPTGESRGGYGANRRPSEPEKPPGREGAAVKPKMDDKSPSEGQKTGPSASPGAAAKGSPVDSDAPSSLSTEPSAAAAQSIGSSPAESASHAESPAASDGDRGAEAPADSEASVVISKSTLNIDAKPFYPRNASIYSSGDPVSTPAYPAAVSNVPIQSPPAAQLPGMAVHARPNVPPHTGQVTMTPGGPVPVFMPQIATPLHSQPIPASALSHMQPPHSAGEVISGSSLPPHPQSIVLHPGPLNSSKGYIQAVGHPNVASPSQMMSPYPATSLHAPIPHAVVSQGIGVPQSMQGAPTVSMAGLTRMNSNGGGKRAVVSVSSTVAGPVSAGLNHRNTSSEMQAAAMTGTPLVAPSQGGPHTPGHPMGHHPQAQNNHMYQTPYYPYPTGATLQQSREANGQPGVPTGNTSQPPTPSSTPQQQFAIAHGAHPAYVNAAYVLPQQLPQGGPPHHPIFQPQHVSVTHQYPHPGQHLQPGAQQLAHGAASMMQGAPPGAVPLYQVHLGHHPSQVTHQQAQHHAHQQHGQQQQQQQQAQQQQQQQQQPQQHIMAMAMGQLSSSAMYQHPAHHQQQQHQQQHSGPTALQHVGPGAGPGIQMSNIHSMHAASHPMTQMSYAQQAAPQYMQQPQHASVAAGAPHVPQ